MSKLFQSEWIEIICGPMFSGKTDEMLRKLNRLSYAKIKYITFKPSIDTRDSIVSLHSRDGRSTPTNSIQKATDIFEILAREENQEIKVVAIDEAQFFDDEIVDVVKTLAKSGYHIILACLDRDYLAKPFGPVPSLLAIADEINKLSAICTKCGREATFSERVIKTENDVILIGDTESYEARCRKHHSTFKKELTKTDILFSEKLSK